MKRSREDRDERRRGQAIVELALFLPILVFVLIGGADLARAYAIQIAVQNGARAGAESAAIDFGTPTAANVIIATRDEMSRTPGMNSLAPTVLVSFLQGDDNTKCVDPPTLASPCYVTVRVQHTFRTVIPWPIIPNAALLDRSTKIRMIKANHCGTGKAKSNKDCNGKTHGSATHH